MRASGQPIPFRVAILTTVVGLLVATCGFLLTFGAHATQQSMDVLKAEHLARVADGTAREVSRLPYIAEQILNVQRHRIESGAYSTEDPLALARALSAALSADPDVEWVSYSEAATGRFMGARRLDASEYILNLSNPRVNGGLPREFRADTLAPYVSATLPTKPYDPRTLAWYRRAEAEAGTVVWMPPYVFAEGVKGITVAVAAVDPSGHVLGVVTVDFALTGIANFLRTITVGRRGVVVLFDQNGERLAGGSGPGLDAATQAVKEWGGTREIGERYREVESGGETWNVVARRLTRGTGFQWTAAVAVPEADFMGPVITSRRTAAVIALGGVLLAVLAGVSLSARMARSLAGATEALDRVAKFDLDLPATGRSRIAEIARLQDAVGRVTASLRSFTRYAPEEIVREVAVSGREAMLSGDTREVTVLFCDLRGFTAFAERRPADEVVAILNDHFELLAALIARHGGFVVDFLGDAVFAVFGALRVAPDHAEQAVACAIEMQGARAARGELNRSRGWPPLEMGIAINTGPVVVGNMGAIRRIKYGAVGSVVNTAARIETFTVGGQTLIADSTRLALGDRVTVRGPFEVEGKGIDTLIRMWEVLELRAQTTLVPPSPAGDLVALPHPLDARVRIFHGKQLDREGFPARIHRLAAAGAQLEASAPLAMFDALQVLVPLGAGGELEALDGKVIEIADLAGRPTAIVRFTGLGWEMQGRLDALARDGVKTP